MLNFNNQNGNYSNNGNRPAQSNGAGDFETLQNARRDLVGELEAIIQYDEHLHKTNIEVARATWENIRNEELTHVGELLGLITYLGPYQKTFIDQGLREFEDRIKK